MTEVIAIDTDIFQLERVIEGIYFAQALPGTGTMGNAAIVDLGDRTLVFDTFLTPQAGQHLRRAAEQLTGRPVSYVINSHHHADHLLGNQAFLPEAIFVATTGTRQIMAQSRTLHDPTRLAAEVAHLEEELAQVQDEAVYRCMSDDLRDYKVLLTAVPGLRCVMPMLTFEEKLVFHGSRRTAELLTYGGGHTASDALLYLPTERLALMGDLALVRKQPLFANGNLQNWQVILDRVLKLDIRTILPGHGALGIREDIDLTRRYLATFETLATSVFERGGTLEDALQLSLPAPFSEWGEEQSFNWNMEAFFEERSSGNNA